MNYGIKVTKPGYDVAIAADNELVFSSAFDTLKVYAVGEGTIASPWDDGVAGPIEVTVNLNLGYIPAFLVYTEIQDGVGAGDDKFYLAPYTTGVSGDFSIMPTMTEFGLTIRFGADLRGPSASYAIDYKYIIFVNDAGT